MIDRSLLSRLPPSDLIRLAALHPLEAAAHFRVAARFCLDGARCVAFRDLEQERLAHRLIADGIALYTLAFQRLESPQPRAIHIPATRQRYPRTADALGQSLRPTTRRWRPRGRTLAARSRYVTTLGRTGPAAPALSD